MSNNNQIPKDLDNTKVLEKPKPPLNDQLRTAYDPAEVLKRAGEKLNTLKNKEDGEYEGKTTAEDDLFKAMTLSEFKNGALLVSVVAEQYKTFGIDMLKKLQEEYSCTTLSEKATAELVTINYIRTLENQNRISRYLAQGTITDTGVRFLDIMSKELDRANRHYLSSLDALKSMKQPNLGVNIRANTAVIGQNQVVQANNNPNDS